MLLSGSPALHVFLLYQKGRDSRIPSGLRPRDRRFRAQGKTARRPTAAEAGFGGKWLELLRFATGNRSRRSPSTSGFYRKKEAASAWMVEKQSTTATAA